MLELQGAKRRHLLSAYAHLAHALRQMAEAAEGRSPTGVGPPLTPLDPDVVEPILAPLRSLKARFRSVVAQLAPAELAAFEASQPRHNTFVWLANLLDAIRMAVDGIQPSRMGRYGRGTSEEQAALAVLHEELSRKLRRARAALEQAQAQQETE